MRTFRAWIDELGSKELERQPDSLRLVDWETDDYRIWFRWVWRWRPFYLAVIPFSRKGRGFTILRLGKKVASDRLQLYTDVPWYVGSWYKLTYHLTKWRYD